MLGHSPRNRQIKRVAQVDLYVGLHIFEKSMTCDGDMMCGSGEKSYLNLFDRFYSHYDDLFRMMAIDLDPYSGDSYRLHHFESKETSLTYIRSMTLKMAADSNHPFYKR